jgi:succinate dehydrogenase hydrophobic anchor subunit
MDSVYALRALAVSAIISVVLAFAHVGLVKSVQGSVHSQDGQLWAGQRWSDMNNMYGWLVENTCRGAQEDFT